MALGGTRAFVEVAGRFDSGDPIQQPTFLKQVTSLRGTEDNVLVKVNCFIRILGGVVHAYVEASSCCLKRRLSVVRRGV